MAVDWGNAPEWATVGIATAALATAFVANTRTRALLAIESSRRSDENLAAAATQAAQVSAWIPESSSEEAELAMSEPELVFPDILVANSSRVPVYNVRFCVWGRDATKPPYLWTINQVLAPTSSPTVVSRYIDQPKMLADILEYSTGVSLGFSDSSGKAWYRGRQGRLLDESEMESDREYQLYQRAQNLSTLPNMVTEMLGYPADRTDRWREEIRRWRQRLG